MPSRSNWKLGLLLAWLTCLFWATLPIALKLSLETLEPITLTWFRFLCAAIFTALLISMRSGFSAYRGLDFQQWLLLAIAALGLIGNYVFYLLGLKYTTPANAQLLIQSAPLLLALGSIIWFKEKIGRFQVLGFFLIVLGLYLFFYEQLQHAAAQATYRYGAGLIFLGAVTWAVYALLQKRLSPRLNSQQFLLVMYVIAAVVLVPFATPSTLLTLDHAHWWAVAYCAFNTIAAYGAFAEAMVLWDGARVSAILTLTPILTFVAMHFLAPLFPAHLSPERIATTGLIGAACVVFGSMTASLLKAKS
jgi:drug/metabolite transporter (DMT)-like permease